MTHPDQRGGGTFAHAHVQDRRAVERALGDLAEVETLAPLLALLRDPRERRPWRETVLDPYARAELDAEARAEIAERTEVAPGEHPDAARPDVLDALSSLLWRAHDLAWHLSRAAVHPPLPAPHADGDPRPYLRRARALLAAAITARPNGTEITRHTAREAAGMLADLRAALALIEDGQTVKAVCPWCHGGLTGAYTWRVRVLPGTRTDLGLVLIVCESGICNPPTKDAGTWWQGCPAWPYPQWPWLARRLAHLDRRRTAEQAPPASPYSSFAGSTGRAGSPTTAAAERELLAGLTDQPADPEGTAA